MNESHQEKAIEAVRDWSKWLIGINFAAVVGCSVVLQSSSEKGTVTPFLIIAIASFAASVFCSILLVRELARVIEILPLRDSSGNLSSVLDHKIASGLTVGALASLQLASLGTGTIFFIIWVLVKSIIA